jgi:hypothetical protein
MSEYNSIAKRPLSKKEKIRYDKITEIKGKDAADDWLRDYLKERIKKNDEMFLRDSSSGFESERNSIRYYYGSGNTFRGTMKSRT